MRNVLLFFCLTILSACATPRTFPSTGQTPSPPVAQQAPPATMLPTPTLSPYAWLEDVACRPPCWEGITPGQTTPEEVLLRLEGDSRFTSVTLQRDLSGVISGTIYAKYLEKSDTGIYFRPGITQPIYAIQNKFRGITLGEVIATLGEPSHVFVYIEVNPKLVNHDYWEIRIIWLDQGTEMVASGYNTAPDIEASLTFNKQTSFFIPTIEGYEDNIRRYDIEDYLQEWQGFNTFDYYSSGAFP